MLTRVLAHTFASRWLRIAALAMAPALADASIIRSVDFQDVAAPGENVFPNVGTDTWRAFQGTRNGGQITQGTAAEGSNVFGSIEVDTDVGETNWHAGQLLLFLGPLPNLDLSDFRLTADLRTNQANAGKRGEFRIESLDDLGGGNFDITGAIEFNPVLDDTFSQVGGRLSDATFIDPTFDLSADAFQIVFAFNYDGLDLDFQPGLDFGTGQHSLHFDNLVFAEAPEPGVAALIGAGFIVLTMRRRRR